METVEVVLLSEAEMIRAVIDGDVSSMATIALLMLVANPVAMACLNDRRNRP